MAENLIGWAEKVYEKYRDQVARIMGVRPPKVTFVIGDTDVAETNDTTITLSRDWFARHPNDAGAIVHEMAHAYMGSDSSGDKWAEGLAEYVRSKVGLASDSGYHAKERDFFLWLDQQNPGSVRRLSQEMADATYQGGDFERVVGVDFATAHKAYEQGTDLPHTPQPGDPGYIPGPGHSGPGPGGAPGTGGGDGAGGNVIGDENPFGQGNGGDGGDGHRHRQRIANAEASFTTMVQAWGIPINDNIQSLIAQAAQHNYNSDRFLQYLRDTPEYRATFKGIFDHGEMRMSEADYLQAMKDYENIASQAGLKVDRQDMIWNIRHDVTPSEFSDRAEGISRLKRNSALMNQFQKELLQTGVAKQVTKKDLMHFVLGQGNQEWKDLWQDTLTRNSAIMAGLTFKQKSDQYLNLNRNVIERVSGRDLSEEEMNQAFSLASEVLLKDLPEAHIQGLGLTKRQIVNAAFGGRGSAEAKAKIDQVRKNAEAQAQNELAAGPSFAGEGGGLKVQTGAQRRYTG